MNTQTILTPPRIGEIWTGQGGRFLGNIRGDTGQPDYHLVTPMEFVELRRRKWGTAEKVPGALNFLDGMANTLAMLDVGSEHAEKVRAIEFEGHRDFYIAAGHEARLGFINAGEHLNNLGPLWTSTQLAWVDAYAWVQDFDNGTQYVVHKSYEYRAFVLRRLPIQ